MNIEKKSALLLSVIWFLRGGQKFGMIPSKIVKQHKDFLVRKSCKIIRMDKINSILVVDLKEGKASISVDEITKSN